MRYPPKSNSTPACRSVFWISLALSVKSQIPFWAFLTITLLPAVALGQTIHTVAGDTAGTVLKNPSGLFVTSNGSVYIADTGKHRIRLVGPLGVVTTFAGTGTAGYTDGPLTNAQFNSPTGVFVDKNGVIYIADSRGNRIRFIPRLKVSRPAVGLSGVTVVSPGADIPIFSVGLRG